MSLPSKIKASFMNGNLGIKVVRPAIADIAGWVSIFTINGGLVQVTGLYAIVTTLHAGAACNLQFRHTTGNTILCALTGAIASPVGTIITITGDPADGAVIGVGTGVDNTAPPIQGGLKGSATAGIQQMGLVCGVGDIQVDWTVVTAGVTRYVLTYIPIDDEAYVFSV